MTLPSKAARRRLRKVAVDQHSSNDLDSLAKVAHDKVLRLEGRFGTLHGDFADHLDDFVAVTRRTELLEKIFVFVDVDKLKSCIDNACLDNSLKLASLDTAFIHCDEQLDALLDTSSLHDVEPHDLKLTPCIQKLQTFDMTADDHDITGQDACSEESLPGPALAKRLPEVKVGISQGKGKGYTRRTELAHTEALAVGIDIDIMRDDSAYSKDDLAKQVLAQKLPQANVGTYQIKGKVCETPAQLALSGIDIDSFELGSDDGYDFGNEICIGEYEQEYVCDCRHCSGQQVVNAMCDDVHHGFGNDFGYGTEIESSEEDYVCFCSRCCGQHVDQITG